LSSIQEENYSKFYIGVSDEGIITGIPIHKDYLPNLIQTIEEKLSTIGVESTDKTDGLETPDGIVGEVVNKMEQQNKYRDDLKCPCPNQLMVWDNRKTKRSDKSPDFTCSGKTPEECPMHTGKWRKSWWLDNSDVPKEWGMER